MTGPKRAGARLIVIKGWNPTWRLSLVPWREPSFQAANSLAGFSFSVGGY